MTNPFYYVNEFIKQKYKEVLISENLLCGEALLSNGDAHNSAAFAHNLGPCVGACHPHEEEEKNAGKEMVCLGMYYCIYVSH